MSQWLLKRRLATGAGDRGGSPTGDIGKRQCIAADVSEHVMLTGSELAAGVVEGNVLDKYASDIMDQLACSRRIPTPWLLPEEVTYCTICSGSDITTPSIAAVEKAINRASLRLDPFPKTKARTRRSIRFKQLWACESDPKKQQFLVDFHSCRASETHPPSSRDSRPCLFTEASQVGKAERFAYCRVHKASCPVVRAQGCIIGFSCKDLSRANTQGPQKAGLLARQCSPGGTANTFQSLLAYMDVAFPDWLLAENSDALADESDSVNEDSNLNLVLAEFANRGCDMFEIIY